MKGLVYSSDDEPGYARRRAGESGRFIFLDTRGRRIGGKATLARLSALGIPPAYEDVWICPSPKGHIQATGRDARGRKQYLYHARWRQQRDADKFAHLTEFALALPALRRRLRRDIAARGLPREKILAAVVLLIDETLVRVGNEAYAAANRSFGITTLRNRHVRFRATRIEFAFRGKSAVEHDIRIDDARLMRVVRQCHDLPGQRLFQYLDADGTPRRIDSSAVNTYLREISGLDITAKEFRTWAGSVEAFARLRLLPPPETASAARREVSTVVKEVAGTLRNTPAVCRKSYVHPAIIEAYQQGMLPAVGTPVRKRGLSADENALLSFLLKKTKPG